MSNTPKRRRKTFVIPQTRRNPKANAREHVMTATPASRHTTDSADHQHVMRSTTRHADGNQPVMASPTTTATSLHQHVIDSEHAHTITSHLASTISTITANANQLANQIITIDNILSAIAATLRFAQPPHNGKIDIRYWTPRKNAPPEPVLVRWIANPYGPNKGHVLTPKPARNIRKVTRSISNDDTLAIIHIAASLIKKRRALLHALHQFSGNFSRSTKKRRNEHATQCITSLQTHIRHIIVAATSAGLSIAADDLQPIQAAIFPHTSSSAN